MARTYWRDPDVPEMSPYEVGDLYDRIKRVGLRHEDLIAICADRGITTRPTELSKIFHGVRQGPKVTKLLRIISEYMEEREGERP